MARQQHHRPGTSAIEIYVSWGPALEEGEAQPGLSRTSGAPVSVLTRRPGRSRSPGLRAVDIATIVSLDLREAF